MSQLTCVSTLVKTAVNIVTTNIGNDQDYLGTTRFNQNKTLEENIGFKFKPKLYNDWWNYSLNILV